MMPHIVGHGNRLAPVGAYDPKGRLCPRFKFSWLRHPLVHVQKLVLANKLLWGEEGKEGRRKRAKRDEGMGERVKGVKSGVKGIGRGRGLKSAASVLACLR